ncbi:MAG: hypothetical protein GY696_16125 [Gammaproteobacteria bacterium]|nr:hypothetical protein [Gammaproteobacteria bacterium]
MLFIKYEASLLMVVLVLISYKIFRPEEAIDGAGATVPLFSQPGGLQPPTGPPGVNSLDPGGGGPSSLVHSPLSLVTAACSSAASGEPLLDLRSFSHHMNSSLLTAAASSSSMAASVSLGSATNILSASLGPPQPPPPVMSPTGNISSHVGSICGIPGGPAGGLLVGGSMDPAAGCHSSPDLRHCA